MRTVKLKVFDKEYTMCYSLRAMDILLNQFGSLDGLSAALTVRDVPETGGDNARDVVENAVNVCDVLLRCGYEYETRCQMSPPEPPDTEALKAGCHFMDLRAAILDAILAGSRRDVEVEPSKKDPEAETTGP